MLINFLFSHWRETLELIGQHLFLVFLSTGLAVLIGLPLGIAMTRVTVLRKPILGFANIMQTIPSLALFGLLIPFFGLGPKTAIAAFFLYALLPIIQNTYAGIQGVDPAVRKAGIGMGMTNRQLLLRVEIPLALAFIIAGIRIATVISVGTATIAAVIDGGGLGRYIFRGLRMNDNTLLLAGAIPAALIAIGANFFFEKLGRGIKNLKYFSIVLILPVFLISIPLGNKSMKIAIGSKDFTEQLILGELLSQVIESTTKMEVVRHFDLGGQLTHQALLSGKIDAYVEYTGTALIALLHMEPQTTPEQDYEKVKEIYSQKYHLIWSKPLGFSNTFTVLVRPEDAKKYRLHKISDLTTVGQHFRAGFGQDFLSRPDGYDRFIKTYHLQFQAIREMDFSLVYRALMNKNVDIIVGNSTDGWIDRLGLVMLEDDRNYFPPYDAAPVVREEVYPKIKPALDILSGLISIDEMRHLNYQVDHDHRSVNEVVMRFLKLKGFPAKLE